MARDRLAAMQSIESERHFRSILTASTAVLFLDFEWSIQAKLSGSVVSEWERTWPIWNPRTQTQLCRVFPDDAPWFVQWVPKDRGDLAGGGHGAVLWLRYGHIVAHEPAAYAAGIRELARRTDEAFSNIEHPPDIEEMPTWRGPFHEFVLADETTFPRSDYLRLIHSPSAIRIADDLIRYMGDSLDWVRTYNPATRSGSHGLNYFGPTVIEATEAAHFRRIFVVWAALFRNAPSRFILRGWWSPSSESYERIEITRASVVELLDSVGALADRLVPGKYLLHFGV